MFRGAIEKALKEGRFKLADKVSADMGVDSDPFPAVAPTNMVFVSGSTSKSGHTRNAWKEPNPWEWKVKKTGAAESKGERSIPLQPRQLKSVVRRPSLFDRLTFPTVDEAPLPEGKRKIAEFNLEEGISTLRITVLNDEQVKPARMIKPKAEVEKGQCFLKKIC